METTNRPVPVLGDAAQARSLAVASQAHAGEGAAPAQGRFGRWDVVAGVISPLQRVASRTALQWASPLVCVLGAAAGYFVGSGGDTHHADTMDRYPPGRDNLVGGGAGALAGALLPTAVAMGVHVVKSWREGKYLRQHPGEQAQRLVQHAQQAGALTLSGLQAQVRKLQQVHEGRPQLLARDLAQLAGIVPLRREAGCLGCCGQTLEQFEYLLGHIAALRTQLRPDPYDDALVGVARNLAADPPLHASQVKELAGLLFAAHDRVRAADGPAATQVHADFMLALCDAPAFAGSPQVVRDAAHLKLHLDRRAYVDAMPPVPRRDAKDSRQTAASAEAARVFLEQFAAQAGRQPDAEQIDALSLALCSSASRGLSPAQIQGLNTVLRDSKSDGDGTALARAKARASLFVNHYPDEARGGGSHAAAVGQPTFVGASARELALRRDGVADEWADASCGLRNGLAYIASADPHNERLQALAREVTEPRVLTARLADHTATPPERLHAEVGQAIGIALSRTSPRARAENLLTIAVAVEGRDDAGRGAFLQGLLTPGQVKALARQVRSEEGVAPGDKATLLRKLPRLCQLQANEGLQATIERHLTVLGTSVFPATETIDWARKDVNLRYRPSTLTCASPTRLHHAWLHPSWQARGAASDRVVEVHELTQKAFASPSRTPALAPGLLASPNPDPA